MDNLRQLKETFPETYQNILANNPELSTGSPQIQARHGIGGEKGTQRPSKYHNTRTELNGRVFDSGKEAARAQELQLLEKAGEISCLCYQVPFRLPAGIVYVADFVYLTMRDGKLEPVAEDVKSEVTRKIASYRMKRKLFKEKFGFEITEV